MTPTTVIAFNRGVQQVELAARDRDAYGFNFYLLTFEQACTRAPAGCNPVALYTPRVESNWTSVRVADQSELADTPADCLQCHARGIDKPMLLMRELDGPWTHFFQPDGAQGELPEPTGVDLLHDYLRAKSDETYAGVPESALRQTSGFALQAFLDHAQPLIFDGSRILNERWPWSPENNGYVTTPLRSETWEHAYQSFKSGAQLALPHFDPRPTDPVKPARLTNAYQAYRSGDLAAEELPDLADIYPDDPQTRAELGFETELDATPAEAIVQACTQCHSDVLDQTLNRARFSVDLSRMSAAEIAVAISRLELPRYAPGAMPPHGRRLFLPKMRWTTAGVPMCWTGSTLARPKACDASIGLLLDWFTAAIQGKPVDDVACEDGETPEYHCSNPARVSAPVALVPPRSRHARPGRAALALPRFRMLHAAERYRCRAAHFAHPRFVEMTDVLAQVTLSNRQDVVEIRHAFLLESVMNREPNLARKSANRSRDRSDHCSMQVIERNLARKYEHRPALVGRREPVLPDVPASYDSSGHACVSNNTSNSFARSVPMPRARLP